MFQSTRSKETSLHVADLPEPAWRRSDFAIRRFVSASTSTEISRERTIAGAMRILELQAPWSEDSDEQEPEQRSGVFTTGIVSTAERGGSRSSSPAASTRGRISLTCSPSAPPSYRADPDVRRLSRNTAGDFETILANCIAHARRRFVDVADNFPDECRHVLETLRRSTEHDAVARRRQDDSRGTAALHQAAQRSAHGRARAVAP